LDVTKVDLTEADLKKVDEMLERPYTEDNEQLQRELEHFKARKFKAEIESVYHFSTDFLINDYIPRKIRLIEMPEIEIVEVVSRKSRVEEFL
jgi:DNA topoisomerase VI subunit A